MRTLRGACPDLMLFRHSVAFATTGHSWGVVWAYTTVGQRLLYFMHRDFGLTRKKFFGPVPSLLREALFLSQKFVYSWQLANFVVHLAPWWRKCLFGHF